MASYLNLQKLMDLLIRLHLDLLMLMAMLKLTYSNFQMHLVTHLY